MRGGTRATSDGSAACDRRRGLAAALWMLVMLAPSHAEDSPLGPLPAGWTVAITDVIAIFSPSDAAGTVTLIAPPVAAKAGDARTAFIDDVPALIEDLFGEARPAGVPVPLPASDAVAPGLTVPLVVALDDGSEARLEATGYAAPGGRMQVFFIAAPIGMAADDPRLGSARTLVDQWRARGLIVTPELSAEVAARAAAAGPPDAGNGAPPAGADAALAHPDDDVENVIQYLRFAFDATKPGEPAEPMAVTALLMKDGRVFEGEMSAPAAFDPASRPPGSPGTGRWQRDGEAYALAFSDGTQGTAVAAAAKTLAAPAALTFAGGYRAIGGPVSEDLPDRLSFYPDGSLLLRSEGRTLSGTYAISQRTIRLAEGGKPERSYLFGLRGDLERPDLLVVGNRIYEREDEGAQPSDRTP